MSMVRRFLNVFRRAKLDRDLEDELEFHRQMRLRKALDQGVSPTSAEEVTKRRMGNLVLAREEMRDARLIGWLASSLQDLRHGVVLLKRDPGLSALMILVLAIGIGGSATMFTLLKAAFLDSLPYRASDRLVTIVEDGGWNPSLSEYLEIRARSRTLEQVAFTEHRDMQVSGGDEPARVFGARVTSSFFPLLGVSAAIGRTFREEDNQPGRAPVVVLTDSFWRTRMGAAPDVLGRTLRLDGQSARVIGVLPAAFRFDYPTLRISEPVDIYVSLPVPQSAVFRSSGAGASAPFRVLGRLGSQISQTQAQSEIRTIADVLVREYPKAYRNRDGGVRPLSLIALPLREAIVGSQRPLLLLLSGCVAILLLIACANTAQLLLARSLRRGREVAIRSALGASPLRLIRQFLLEGLVLALCGAVAGLTASHWLTRLVILLLPARSPLLEAAHVDAQVVAFTLATSLISAIVFSIIPAFKSSESTSVLSARAAAGEGSRLRHLMIAVEASLSVFLLCGAGLVAQNLWTLLTTPTGFDPNHVIAFRLKPPPAQPVVIDTKSPVLFHEYLERISAIPGVDSAATVTGPPLRPSVSGPTELVGVTGPAGVLKSVIADNHLVS